MAGGLSQRFREIPSKNKAAGLPPPPPPHSLSKGAGCPAENYDSKTSDYVTHSKHLNTMKILLTTPRIRNLKSKSPKPHSALPAEAAAR